MSNEQTQEQLPEWVINYDKANHQSSAGKAIRILMDKYKYLQEENNKLREALELLDTAIDYAGENNSDYILGTNDVKMIKEALINK